MPNSPELQAEYQKQQRFEERSRVTPKAMGAGATFDAGTYPAFL